MLQVRNIKKEYRTGALVQRALDGVSLNFRDNEFVAILGPSGSGKTTLLNIIGGLDRYDSGDLIINGVSTKEYTDRDWDSYRNHTIGFVFQSYNLIAHQSILSNVELALTIGGIPKEERTRRAIEALEKVGLGDQIHKLPTQLSGGQMQRVAIARALVTDPDILLADEPTGALDTETSIQVMDLIKEIAKDRLVIMVTHNPELAEEYATRIVRLRDGRIISDTDPFVVDTDEGVHRNLGRASMSFGTALALSFNNLKSKLTRTLLVAFAGSIGIIGIALILSLSNGVNKYITSIEEDTLNEYPILINSMSFDSSTMFKQKDAENNAEGEVVEAPIMNTMFSMMDENDLKSLRKYLESGKTDIKKYAKAIEYTYGITPQIFRLTDDDTEYKQINPDQTMEKAGLGYGGGNIIMGTAYQSDVFHQLPVQENLYKDQYEVKAGRWPEKYNEVIVVLSSSGTMSDLALMDLGLVSDKEYNEKLEAMAKGDKIEVDKDAEVRTFKYKDLIGRKYKLVNAFEEYTYNSSRGVWTSMADDEAYMLDLIKRSEDIEIVGVVKPKEGVKITMLNTDLYYTPELIDHLIDSAAKSKIVEDQKSDKKINVLTGEPFGEDADTGFNMGSMFTFNDKALENAIKVDTSVFDNLGQEDDDEAEVDEDAMSDLFTPDMFKEILPTLSKEQLEPMIRMLTNAYTAEALENIFSATVEDFLASSNYSKLEDAVAEYLKSDSAKTVMSDFLSNLLTTKLKDAIGQNELSGVVETVMAGYSDYAKAKFKDESKNLTEENIAAMLTPENIKDYLGTSEAASLLSSEQAALVNNAVNNIKITDEDMADLAGKLSEGYTKYAADNNIPDPSTFVDDYKAYLNSPQGQMKIAAEAQKYIDSETLAEVLADTMAKYTDGLASATSMIMSQMMQEIVKNLQESMSGMMGGFTEQYKEAMSNMIKIDPNAFANAFSVNFSEEDMTKLMASMLNASSNSYDSNMQAFGYANLNDPMQIQIYPYNFDSKDKIKEILDDYNKKMEKTDEDKVIIYTDIVATLMGSVTDIINAISYVLIAFVSISLIVSSIMIGVITYISVLERRKEIGILRAIGASKRNISEVFNAETFIIGLLAGVMGIIVSLLLIIPINMIIAHVTTANMRAALPPVAAIVLIILSVILTLIGGIIPSRAAANSDPVTALRVE